MLHGRFLTPLSLARSLLSSIPDETIVPPDVPSYLSSQGTLSERQDVCIKVESGGGPQPNGHIDPTGNPSPLRYAPL